MVVKGGGKKNMDELPNQQQVIQKLRGLASKTFFVKMGCVYLLSKRRFDELSQIEEATTQDFRSDVRKILTSDERVISVDYFALDKEVEPWFVHSMFVPIEAFVGEDEESLGEGFRLQTATLPFLVELKLEVRSKDEKRFWQEFPLYRKMEKCYVWYNGAIFMAYTDDPNAFRSGFGQATRDVLEEIFEASELVDAEIMEPSPILPDIEILLFSHDKAKEVLGDSSLKAFMTQKPMFGNKLIVALPVAEDRLQDKLKEPLLDVYLNLWFPLIDFYRAQTFRLVAIHREAQLRKEFEKLRAAARRLQSVKPWVLLEHFKATRSLERSVSTTTLSLIDAREAYTRLSWEVGQVRRSMKDSPIASCLVDYFVENSQESPDIDPEALVTVLERLDSEAERHSLSQAQLLAAFMGGIAGAGLTLLVGWLIHLWGA